MEFPMHEELPPICQLPFHLTREQLVVFDVTSTPERITSILNNTNSMLMGYFRFCSENESISSICIKSSPHTMSGIDPVDRGN
ncbi:hypothetical protein BDB01DRAFT_529858 [Pilobolus umbonatus]|nr:hypothetical protein BDB01DRAFT_529858 [Pilobolus umbonatus]